MGHDAVAPHHAMDVFGVGYFGVGHLADALLLVIHLDEGRGAAQVAVDALRFPGHGPGGPVVAVLQHTSPARPTAAHMLPLAAPAGFDPDAFLRASLLAGVPVREVGVSGWEGALSQPGGPAQPWRPEPCPQCAGDLTNPSALLSLPPSTFSA